MFTDAGDSTGGLRQLISMGECETAGTMAKLSNAHHNDVSAYRHVLHG
jgi:hypothetical protein